MHMSGISPKYLPSSRCIFLLCSCGWNMINSEGHHKGPAVGKHPHNIPEFHKTRTALFSYSRNMARLFENCCFSNLCGPIVLPKTENEQLQMFFLNLCVSVLGLYL